MSWEGSVGCNGSPFCTTTWYQPCHYSSPQYAHNIHASYIDKDVCLPSTVDLNMCVVKGSNLLILGEPGVCVCVCVHVCGCVCVCGVYRCCILVSGCGKSSLLRVLRQLWRPAAGTHMSPCYLDFDKMYTHTHMQGSARLWLSDSHRDVMFLPQKPYLTTGSLADQVWTGMSPAP